MFRNGCVTFDKVWECVVVGYTLVDAAVVVELYADIHRESFILIYC